MGDYKNAKSLTMWLRLKYNMPYNTFRSKNKRRKDILRAEFTNDTGIKLIQEET